MVHIREALGAAVCIILATTRSAAFSPSAAQVPGVKRSCLVVGSVLLAAVSRLGNDDDFVSDNKSLIAKTYGREVVGPIPDVIDQEGAMKAFFTSREEWFPLFRKISGSGLPADTACLLDDIARSSISETELEFHESSFPWKRFEAIPEIETERDFLAKFLDSMHESLLAIPVTEVRNPESSPDDEDDLQFLEEGRRLLAISRFHVLAENQGGSVESIDQLFTRVWSELMELRNNDQAHTGSLILLPDYELSDLRRFADMNVVRPLQWLGIQKDFEVVSLQRDSPGIRLLYKLNDMPSGDAYTEEDGFAAASSQ
jgi:hypothetical protein